jgi:predicted RNase H-related nuclease YkuK (DUF458 family)
MSKSKSSPNLIDPYDNEYDSWYDSDGNQYSSNDIITFADKHKHPLHIGSDSHLIGDNYIFATAICFYEPGKGGSFFIKRFSIERKYCSTLGMRLQQEVFQSISTANAITEALSHKEITIHIDCNVSEVHKSSKYHKMLKNYAISSGYGCMVKPNSWAAFVADKFAK